jgi:hypothetical protein
MNQLPEKDLPPGRHRLLKEHLMTEIRQEEKKPVRRPWLRPALVAGAVAAVTAVTLTLAVPSSDGDSSVPPAAKGAPGVTQLLEDAALVAQQQDVPKVRDDQFTYIKSKEAWGISERTCKVATAGPLQNREVWTSVDGRSEGLRRSTELGTLPVHPDPDSGDFYRGWEKLPTDPDRMLAWLYEQNTTKEGYGPAYYAFKAASGLALESILPPEVGAALYRAVAKIPGVVLVKDSVDAAGRHGTAVGFVDEKGTYRQELIFDSKTWLPLGSRWVQLKDVKSDLDVGCNGVIKAGSVQAITAVLERAIVDKKDQRP